MKLEIEIGDKVRIIGDCEETHLKYSLVAGMKEYLHRDTLYDVERVLKSSAGEILGVRVKGYSWHIDDVVLVEKANGEKVNEEIDEKTLKESFFKLNENLIEYIIS